MLTALLHLSTGEVVEGSGGAIGYLYEYTIVA